MSKILTFFGSYARLIYMIEDKVLQDLGLTEIEAKIYLAAIELGSDSVLRIAKKAEVKRPTAYVALDNLTEKGFVSKIEKGNKTHYTAEDPSVVLNKYKTKLANFVDLLPYYRAKYNKGAKPKIKFYEGAEALREVYNQALFPSEEIMFFGADLAKLEKRLPESFNDWIKVVEQNPKKNYREINQYDKVAVNYVKKTNSQKRVRFMPKDLLVATDSVITKDKFFIVSLDNLFGVLIESEDIAKTYKSLFELAWRSAEIIK